MPTFQTSSLTLRFLIFPYASYDKNYSYVEMLDAFHAGRLSVINNVQAESGT